MSFLDVSFLWAVPLAVIPLVIHLLSRRRRNVIRWGAMRFLRAAATKRRQIWRVNDWLLMAMRIAALALLVLALARPLVRSDWTGGSSRPRDVVIVLDTSLSTARMTRGGGLAEPSAVFSSLLQEADRVLDRLNRGDVVRILLASSVPRWLVREPIELDSGNKAELRDRFRQVKPGLGRADLLRCVEEAVKAPSANTSLPRVVAVLTDGQAYGWNGSAGASWRAIQETLQTRASGGVVNVTVAGPATSAITNLSMEFVAAPRSVMARGEVLPLAATIRNAGTVRSVPTQATWSVDGATIETMPVPALEPGETTSLSTDYRSDEVGTRELVCEIAPGDELGLDNADGTILEVADSMPVLIVDGSGRSDPTWSDTAYLLAALGTTSESRQDWHSPFKAIVVQPSELVGRRLEDYRCVILANVSRLHAEIPPRLIAYARAGGGVWIVLGDQTVPSAMNAALGGKDKLMPLALLETPAGDPRQREQFDILRVPNAQHPAARLLGDPGHLDLDQVQVYCRQQYARVREDSPVPILLATGKGEPVAVEGTCGRGRVIVQTIPLGVSWSNLPTCQAFVVLVHEWLWYLSEPSMSRWNLRPGESFDVAFAPGETAETGALQTPSGERVDMRSFPRNGKNVWRYGPLVEPGRYVLTTTGSAVPRGGLPFRVGRDTRESDLTPLSEAEKQQLAASAGLRFVADPLSDDPVRPGSKYSEPIWTVLLVALVILLLGESGWAGRLSRTRCRSAPVPAMEPT